MTAAQIRAQQAERFQRINGLTDLQVKQLSDFCMKRSDFNPLVSRQTRFRDTQTGLCSIGDHQASSPIS